MVKEAGYIEKLDELVKVKKADESVLTTINDNELGYKKAKENLELLLKEIEKIENKLEEKRQERKQIPIYKVKELTQVIKEISTIKKEYANKLDEKTYLEEFCKEKQKQNNEIKEEIENQYKIYQETEIYIKAVEKISKKNIELSAEFYAGYVNHMNEYMNLKYSLKDDTKLIEPNVNDLTTLLSILQKNEEKSVKKATRKKATKTENKEESAEKKTTTRRKSTKAEKKEEPAEKKTTTRRKSTKTEEKEEPAEKKTATRKKATKTENKEEPAEKKTATRKKATKTENKEEPAEKKTTTRKKVTKVEEKEEPVEKKKTTTRKRATKTENKEETTDNESTSKK